MEKGESYSYISVQVIPSGARALSLSSRLRNSTEFSNSYGSIVRLHLVSAVPSWSVPCRDRFPFTSKATGVADSTLLTSIAVIARLVQSVMCAFCRRTQLPSRFLGRACLIFTRWTSHVWCLLALVCSGNGSARHGVQNAFSNRNNWNPFRRLAEDLTQPE